MYPLTLLASNKVVNLLTTSDALATAVSASAAAARLSIAPMAPNQIMVSYVTPEMGDLQLTLSYPRILVYTRQIVNQQKEKFRAFSGTAHVVADIWSSASLEQDTETALHFYVEGIASLLRSNIGDWGDGCRYSGEYDVQMQTPKTGGVGFVQFARVTCTLDVSFN